MPVSRVASGHAFLRLFSLLELVLVLRNYVSTTVSSRAESLLPAVGVAPDAHVHEGERLLVGARAFYVARHEDGAGARAEHGHAGRMRGAQRLVQAVDGQELRDGRGLAARDHEAVQPVQLGRPAHEARVGPQPFEHAPMLAEGALQSQDADALPRHASLTSRVRP